MTLGNLSNSPSLFACVASVCAYVVFVPVAPAMAQDTEQAVQPSNLEVTTDQPSYSQCSAAFHTDLNRIGEAYAKPLRESVRTGRNRDKSLPRGLTYSVPKTSKSKELNAAIRFASRTSSRQGSDGWLRSDGGRWLTDAISLGLVRYTTQPASPFLCTGMKEYLGYLEPHEKKITRVNNQRAVHLDAALAALDPAFDRAWNAMRPAPLPFWAPKRPSVLPDVELRDSTSGNLDVQETSERKVIAPENSSDVETTGSVESVTSDPDLPPIGEEEAIFALASLQDGVGAISKLRDRLIETGNLAPDSVDPLLGTGGDLVELLANTRKWVRGNTPEIVDVGVRADVNGALSALEVAQVIDANTYSLAQVEQRMSNTFDAIRASHARRCTCE